MTRKIIMFVLKTERRLSSPYSVRLAFALEVNSNNQNPYTPWLVFLEVTAERKFCWFFFFS
jgi:hypothetical protein